METSNCPHCGKQLDDHLFRFCSHCNGDIRDIFIAHRDRSKKQRIEDLTQSKLE